MNNNIFALGKNLKRGTVNRVAAVVLAGTMIFSTGAIMEISAFSLKEPDFSYSDFLGYNGTKIFINGRFVEFNNNTGYPMLINDTTYIPVSVLENVFNAYVYCSNETGRIFMSKHGAQLRLSVENNSKIYIPDLDNPMKERIETTTNNCSFVSNGIVYVPLREVFETFGAKVIWNGESNSITVVGDYEKNSQNLDFKDENVFTIKDVDLSKEYSKIIYDGQVVETDYLKLLLNANEYKVIEQDGILYVFSYQYLFDVNYIYGVHRERKNNLVDRDTAYELWSINKEEIDYARKLAFLDGYRSSSFDMTIDMDMSGMVYNLMSLGSEKEYSEVNKIVDEIVSRVRKSTDNPEEMVRLVNNELCDLINVHAVKDDEMYDAPSIYTAIINKDGVCDGYSIAFKYIMDKLGIPCVRVGGMVRGTAIPHGWNEVYVNGEWKIVDVYANDKIRRDRYLLSDMDDKDWNKLIAVGEDDRLEAELAKLTLKLNNASEETVK